MTRRTWLSLGSLVLMLALPRVVQADPIFFTTTGLIQLGEGHVETFQGSFWLADPVISLYDGTDSRGDQLNQFAVTDFALTSVSYSLAGAGNLFVWWGTGRDDRGAFVNDLDSLMVLSTSVGALATPPLQFASNWQGIPGVQPEMFSGMSADISGGRGGRILDLTAVRARVPEPSTLLVLAAGFAGLAFRRRQRP